MQVLLPAFQSGEGPIDFRSEFEQEEKVLRPLESEKTFLLVQVKLSTSRKWKLSRLCFVARASYRVCVLVSVSFLSYFLLPLPPFFPILSLVRIYHDSQHRLNAIFLLLYRTLPKRGSARTIR